MMAMRPRPNSMRVAVANVNGDIDANMVGLGL
jgi:hypothetical protein